MQVYARPRWPSSSSRFRNLLVLSSAELLQVLVDVLASMDNEMALDVRTQENEEMVSKIIQFIKILKYPGALKFEFRHDFPRRAGAG